MFPTAALSRAEHYDDITQAPWNLDPTLLPLLHDIVADVAVAGIGARLVMAVPHGRPRVLVSAGCGQSSWRSLALAVLDRDETLSNTGSVAAPLYGANGLRGVLMLHQDPSKEYHGAERLMQAHASQVETALSIASMRLTATRGAVEALLQSLAAHDAETARHALVVRRLAHTLGTAMRLEPYALLELEWAALLHDMGKIAVSPGVLQKAGPLTTAEWTLIRQHPATGERIVRAVPGLNAVGLALRHHHERWDGGGYPDRLAGDNIPLHGRLVSLVDAYETMRTGRPYRRALTRDEALGELRRGAGAQFDPGLLRWLPALVAQDVAPS